ncbi:MAG: Tn3 family transposase [Pyrinomonadaceae bacterium]|nr:Tn3 family transposase [Pyrinomonadaceae bacterium]
MPATYETAYPRLKHSVSERELQEFYGPSVDELAIATEAARGVEHKICFLILLKTFQRLGYFVQLRDIPKPIVEYISLLFGVHYDAIEWEAYDHSGTRRRHIALIREHLNVRPFDQYAQQIAEATSRSVAETREDLDDLVNATIEELVRQCYELPGFRTLLDTARRIRAETNRNYYNGVWNALGEQRRQLIDDLLSTDGTSHPSLWQNLKLDPGAPTLKEFRLLIERLKWLKSLGLHEASLLASIPSIKVRRFAQEAASLNAARMSEMEVEKCSTLVVALVQRQIARCLDDLGEMIIRRMRKTHTRARQALSDYLWQHQPDTDRLIGLLYELLQAWQQKSELQARVSAFDQLIGNQIESLMLACQAHAAHSNRNYLPFLWQFYQDHRQILFAVLAEIELRSTTPDDSLCRALTFILTQRKHRKEWLSLSVSNNEQALSLDWIPDKWWKPVTGKESRKVAITEARRRYFEMCLFTETAQALQNGDLVMLGSEKFGDYREQFVSPEEYGATVDLYCQQIELPVERNLLLDQLREQLTTRAEEVDASFPENEDLRIEDGEPVLRKLRRTPEAAQLRQTQRLVSESISDINILDALVDTESWLNWTRSFGPLSGYKTKLDNPAAHYVATVFSYGCNMGPSQAARSLTGLDRRQIAWINQRHITEEKLDEAITRVINGYNRFRLPELWGSGRSASADGTKWDLYEQNLLSEYHIRYGSYGGVGYYVISDQYIALFSHFISCGVREAVFILDGLLQNRSDIQPDLIHSDTHGQTAVVFGLAYLLGIRLMPRIKNWKHLDFCRPERGDHYQHIDSLFTTTVDWKLIGDHLDEMLRVAVSIKAGKLLPSTILRRLGSYSRHNRLYQAFRELGLVVRTEFLLNFISDLDLRRLIQAAMNKSERFNQFAQWVEFGGKGVIAENDRTAQRKLIKYNHLVANCLIFHNVFAMTGALHRLLREGVAVSEETLRHLSPYLTEHINRFGVYEWNLRRVVPPINYGLEILPASYR